MIPKDTGISGALFDLYGTLFTYGNMAKAFSLWREDLAKALKALDISVSHSALAKQSKHFFSKPIEPDGRFTDYEVRLVNLARQNGADPDENWVKHTAAVSMNRWQRLVPIHPQTVPLLQKLKGRGVRVGVISNFQHAPHVRKVLRRHGLLNILDAVVISGEVRHQKPEPEIFRIALERLGTRPEDTLYVGDDPVRDIAGAKSVGMQTKLFQNGASLFDIFRGVL